MKAYSLEAALRQAEETTELTLHLSRAQPFPVEVRRLTGLRRLYVKGGHLTELPPVLADLSRLEVLSFQESGLASTGPVLAELRQLERLDLNGNELSEWPPELSRLKRLRVLHLAGNQLRSLPPAAGRSTALQRLVLSNNRIGRLSKALGDCTQLEHLDLGFNRIRRLPSTLGKLGKLRSLKLEHNRLQTLPETLWGCRELQRLNLAGNCLPEAPAALRAMEWLTQLNLERNKLTALPAWLGALERLERLELGGNGLEELPPVFESMERLTQLGLAGNRIRLLPALPPRLRELNLQGNDLETLPPAVRRAENLAELDVSSNRLTTLDREWCDLRNLKTLRAYRNSIQAQPEDLMCLPHLQEVAGLLHPRTERRFNEFIRRVPPACRPSERNMIWWYRIYCRDGAVWDEMSWEDLCRALNSPLWEVRHRTYLRLVRTCRAPLRKGAVVAPLGRPVSDPEELKERLEKQRIGWRAMPDEQTTHLLLGEAPDCRQCPGPPPGLLSEPRLLRRLDKMENRHLATGNDPEAIGRLRQLLLHDDVRNVRIAMGILRGGGVPKVLLTELFLAYCRLMEAPFRQEELGHLLRPCLSPGGRAQLAEGGALGEELSGGVRPFFGGLSEEVLAKISRICRDSEFKKERITAHLRSLLTL